MSETNEPYLPGGIVSLDPLVTYSRQAPYAACGLASLTPELFRGKKALHFVGFSVAAESLRDGWTDELTRLSRDLGDNQFVFCCNTDIEAFELNRLGVPAMVASHLSLIDEKTYRPMQADPSLPTRQAVYNARFATYKRHHLAAEVGSLMLVYDINHDRTGATEASVRRSLPHAWYAQHELNGGVYRKLPVDKLVQLVNQCSVGLCLSELEGAMRASMEYLLCGLMVVTTENTGGRDRYLHPPYAVTVPAEPVAVADAVQRFIDKPIPKLAIRDHIGRLVSFERHNFLATVNWFMERQFGTGRTFPSLDGFIANANEWRHVRDIVRPLLPQ